MLREPPPSSDNISSAGPELSPFEPQHAGVGSSVAQVASAGVDAATHQQSLGRLPSTPRPRLRQAPTTAAVAAARTQTRMGSRSFHAKGVLEGLARTGTQPAASSTKDPGGQLPTLQVVDPSPRPVLLLLALPITLLAAHHLRTRRERIADDDSLHASRTAYDLPCRTSSITRQRWGPSMRPEAHALHKQASSNGKRRRNGRPMASTKACAGHRGQDLISQHLFVTHYGDVPAQ
ncbi:uncharacterized protein B0H18DRAFT_1116087 [Fomitopsis serialis]|uniref:uncharacterized protein n=1 Tax=Fomitopsis serialis TaxID=139415 RepID=UPI002007765C|nr:uncharacterized protein B0H18DRAFT_1116087 [Neoantrodia serialis]KAH9931834.1 hypothetical protein B0H18DRAFT_1116087 [Neoantrodia serialis]